MNDNNIINDESTESIQNMSDSFKKMHNDLGKGAELFKGFGELLESMVNEYKPVSKRGLNNTKQINN